MNRWAYGVVAVAAAAALIVAAMRWSPQVPGDAAATPLARTVMTGEVLSDPPDGTDASQMPASPAGSECLPRLEQPDGWFDVCWEAHRLPNDLDPQKDYYQVHLYGTFGPGSNGSPRWAVLKAGLVGSLADAVLDGWPLGDYDGGCQPQPVALQIGDPPLDETLCGHTRGDRVDPWGWAVTWTCQGCLLPDNDDKSLVLYVAVGVPEGTVPEWDVFADVGG